MSQARAFTNVVLGLLAVVIGGCRNDDPPPADPLGAAQVQPAITTGGTPRAVVVDGEVVWVADETGGTLQRVGAQTRRRIGRPIAVGRAPFALAVGEGAVWVAGGDGSIRSIDPKTAEVQGTPVRVLGANGLAVGEGGVWVTSRIAGTVTRVDPQTRRPDPPIRVGEGPADVIVAEGSVWVANAAAGSVTRIDPESSTASPPIDVGGSGVLALDGGEEGIWLARALGVVGERVEVVRLDTDAEEPVEKAVAVPGAVPLDLAVGARGVWVTDVGGVQPPDPKRAASVTRIDPRTSKVLGRPLLVGERPAAIAVGAGGVWVANAGDGSLTPITVSP